MAINYSVDRLRQDEKDRLHIATELRIIKQQYEIRNCTVIDVGCGVGQNLQIFKHDNRTLGIEGLTSAALQAESRGLTVLRGDLELPLEVESRSADWVLCLDVLEHLVNPFGLLAEIRRILRNAGKAILNVPNHFTFGGRVKILLGHNLDVHSFFPDNNDWDNPHLRFFTHRGMRQMIEAAGFMILEDRSGHFCGVPKQDILQRLGLNGVIGKLATRHPGAFAAGFFLVIQKR
jgi:SAM-dependent methyltransferase